MIEIKSERDKFLQLLKWQVEYYSSLSDEELSKNDEFLDEAQVETVISYYRLIMNALIEVDSFQYRVFKEKTATQVNIEEKGE
jgi:hypothetical protein